MNIGDFESLLQKRQRHIVRENTSGVYVGFYRNIIDALSEVIIYRQSREYRTPGE